MPVEFQQNKKIKFSVNQSMNAQRKHRKMFVYSKRISDIDFQQMYDDLKQNVASLVQQNRLKLIAMNLTRSKDLVNKTQNKLVSYLRSKSGKKRFFDNSSTERPNKINIYFNMQNTKQSHQQIFDFNKLEKIIKNYQRQRKSQINSFNGALAQKVIKLTQRKLLKRPLSHRILNNSTAQSKQRSKNYLGWAEQKNKKRLKHMFS